MESVWVVSTHRGHGESMSVFGVFDSYESARDALKTEFPHMKVYGENGKLRGRPKNPNEFHWGASYAEGEQFPVQSPTSVASG